MDGGCRRAEPPYCQPRQGIALCVQYELHLEPEQISDIMISFSVHSVRGFEVTDLNNKVNRFKFGPHIPYRGIISCVIPRLPLNAGQYHISIYSEINGQISDWVPEVFLLRVEPGLYFKNGEELNVRYPFFIDHSWHLKTSMNDT